MELKEVFNKYKIYSTDGNPDIFWRWLGESTLIILEVLCATHLIVKYLKYKGML
jgi:hypothetical protein